MEATSTLNLHCENLVSPRLNPTPRSFFPFLLGLLSVTNSSIGFVVLVLRHSNCKIKRTILFISQVFTSLAFPQHLIGFHARHFLHSMSTLRGLAPLRSRDDYFLLFRCSSSVTLLACFPSSCVSCYPCGKVQGALSGPAQPSFQYFYIYLFIHSTYWRCG